MSTYSLQLRQPRARVIARLRRASMPIPHQRPSERMRALGRDIATESRERDLGGDDR